MLDIIKGQTVKNAETNLLIDFLTKNESTGRLYIGYIMPIIHGQALQKVDVLWISGKYGIIAFNINKEENEDEIDELYRIIDVFLRSNKEFTKKRNLLMRIRS